MTRHGDGCDCPHCLRAYQERSLWLGAIFIVLAAVATVEVARWLYNLFIR